MTTFSALFPRRVAAPVEAEGAELSLDYQRLTEVAWRTLRRLGVDEHAVPDATQDALLVLHRRRHEFRGDSSPQTWVYGVLLRVASDHRRSRRRKDRVFAAPEPTLVERTESPEPGPQELAERRAATRLLHRLLEELPEELREVFVLVELEELVLQEAALALGCRTSTCKSRLRSARRLFNAAVARERTRAQHREGTPR